MRAAWLLVSLSGCVVVQTIVEEERAVEAFDAVSVEGSADVQVTVGVEPSVRVVCDAEQIGQLVTDVVGGVLVVDTLGSGPFEGWGRCDVFVVATALRSLASQGSGDVFADVAGLGLVDLSSNGSGDLEVFGIDASLVATAQGSGDVELEGQAQELFVSSNGSGDVEAEDLVSTTAEVEARGSGDVTVTATSRATVTLSGSGDVVVLGGADVDVEDSGSGDVIVR